MRSEGWSVARRASGYWWWAAAVAALTGLAAVVAVGLVRPWSDPVVPVAAPTRSPEPEPEAVLSAAGTAAPAPTAEGVRAAIDELVRGGELGEAVSVSVVDAVTGADLYRHQADRPTIPASTVKLLTAATLLATHGPAYRLATVAVAGAEPGEVVLVGGGDPTLSVDGNGFYPGAARLDQLAEQVREALGDTPVRQVTIDSSRFTGPVFGPWADDIPGSGFVGPVTALMTDGGRVDPDPAIAQRPALRWDEPDLAAGEAFAELLDAPGEVVRGQAPPAGGGPGPTAPATGGAGPTDPATGGTPTDPAGVPPPGAELGRVSSPPVQRLIEIMLASSDNVVAEGLARQVAHARGEPASFEGAARAMATVLDELGLARGDSVLADGSGLSRDNRLTATLLTDLLASAAAGPERPHAGVFAALPVAGWSGTLADRFRSPEPQTEPGAGYVRAKTGSLAGVDALAGLVTTADGRVLAFALLADAVPVDQETARVALDRIAATLAGCGCR
ncbi:MAG: D-alanyl-D-alanine carboxypeptidase/D-alanyl-D-alanine-endopeptidase [Micromonosporaceae bacterium]|nr:D-alanyl-D-alanine carboxypeptidase/D-alanyl-D-alanine-endopeptidase [Micromonosporaceae bacterium]